MVAPSTSPDQLVTWGQAARLSRLEQAAKLARTNPRVFAQLVLKDERTGKGIKLAPVHKDWHALIDKHPRSIIWSSVESGKSTQISVGRTLYELGKDRSLRCCILSNTHGQAVKITRAIAQYVENSPELKLVWPDMVPGPIWSSTQLFLKRDTIARDPSVQAAGVHGNITGSRLDFVIIDDILDYENTRTKQLRDDLWDWLHATLHGRLTEHSRVCIVGTAYHPEDAMHRYAKEWGPAVSRRYPVVDDVTGEPRWPERWSPARIAAKSVELGPTEFARQMLCKPRDEKTARFKQEWIDRCLFRGLEKDLAYALHVVPQGCKVITGVDLAVSPKDSADLTVLFTMIIHPNGDREVLEIQAGRWSGPDIVTKIVDVHKRYQSLVVVENNAAQDFILQFARAQSAVPLRAFTTGRNKAHPEFGVESIAAEMANGKWIIPCRGGIAREVNAWISEMRDYDPAAHTGDRLMACWFAREGVRLESIKAETGRVDLMRR